MSSLAALAADRGLRFVLFSFSDLFGVQRAKLVPASALQALEQGGAASPDSRPGSTCRRRRLICSPSPIPPA